MTNCQVQSIVHFVEATTSGFLTQDKILGFQHFKSFLALSSWVGLFNNTQLGYLVPGLFFFKDTN
jgi:hypothetical protein